MLQDTELPIFEVSVRVSFHDITYFGRPFRKYKGFSPSEYRQQFCWML
jgi:AraC family L-rhamnose operon regulatory protein RhaS